MSTVPSTTPVLQPIGDDSVICDPESDVCVMPPASDIQE